MPRPKPTCVLCDEWRCGKRRFPARKCAAFPCWTERHVLWCTGEWNSQACDDVGNVLNVASLFVIRHAICVHLSPCIETLNMWLTCLVNRIMLFALLKWKYLSIFGVQKWIRLIHMQLACAFCHIQIRLLGVFVENCIWSVSFLRSVYFSRIKENIDLQISAFHQQLCQK